MTKTAEISQEQIDSWKEQFGEVFKLSSNGLTGYIKSPCTSLAILKQAYKALDSSHVEFAVSILNNCWLGGDKELLQVQKFGNGFNDQVAKVAALTDFELEPTKEGYLAKVGSETLKLRRAERNDLIESEQANVRNEAFETNIKLLDLICLEPEKLQEIKMNDRVYLGFIRAAGHAKDKAAVRVEKL